MATAQSERVFVLPGDQINPSLIPSHPKRALRLGPGLRHIPPNELIPTVAGQLVTDPRKNSIWVEYNGGRYVPTVGDLVIGTMHHSAADYFYVMLSNYTSNAILPQLAFEMATKKTRPNLNPGALVYARVCLANRHMDPELECVSPSTGKADGLGPLNGGMLFDISLGMARRLLMRKSAEEGKVVVLEELGSAGLAFETAVGRNGKIWVNSEKTKTVLMVGRAVKETDEKSLTIDQQKKLVRKLVKEMS
ncbi:Exosome complex component RRP40 [Daldinia childiae]|uniref:Exosome complex component RRP40 n=1 Tax=Daldinia childiae TaxID=326645 RepID=UPI0014480F76|nr:Exosome complex component RRP40 [Daldinia childiae]KAF3061828.1 Exosome complex component RRP40 [Daldinia childiae]